MHEKFDRIVQIGYLKDNWSSYDSDNNFVSKYSEIDGKTIKTFCHKGYVYSSNYLGNNLYLFLNKAPCIVLSISDTDEFNFEALLNNVRRYSGSCLFVFALGKSITNEQRQQIFTIGNKCNCEDNCFYVDGMDDNKCIEFATKLVIDKQFATKLVNDRKAAIEKAEKEEARKQSLLDSAPRERNLVCAQLCAPLYRERAAFLKRKYYIAKAKGWRHEAEATNRHYLCHLWLDDIDMRRFNIIQNLIQTIEDITNKTQITIDNIDTWKTVYQKELKDAVMNSLNDARLDKYNSYEKLGIALLNLITFLLSPIKKLTTGSYFFSTTGKSKEAVEEVNELIDNSQTFKDYYGG